MDEAAGVTERCVAISRAAFGRGDLDAAVADLHRLPAGLAVRGVLAADLLPALLRSMSLADRDRIRQIAALLEIAERNPPDTAEWPQVRAGARSVALLQAGVDGEVADDRAMLAELGSLLDEVGGDDNPATAPLIGSVRSMLTYLQAVESGDEAALRRFPDEARRIRDRLAGNPAMSHLADTFAGLVDVIGANHRNEDLRPSIDRLRQSVEHLPPDDPLRSAFEEMAIVAGPLAGLYGDGPDALTDEQLAAMASVTLRPGLGAEGQASYHGGVGGAAVNSGWGADPARVEQGIEHLRTAVALVGPDSPKRPLHLLGLAVALYHHGELTSSTGDVEEADGLLEQARTLAGGPAHPMWGAINEMLSHTRRRRGAAPDPHRVALEGLQEHAWKVLLQSDLPAANRAARRAARDAVDVARQCLIFNDPADAIRALDAGRGLALHAATEVRNIPRRLDDAGRPDLAGRWREAAATGSAESLPTGLRHEVLTVLAAPGGGGAPLDVPGLDEIRAALAALDADALVYLVPGDGPVPGFAVIAPQRGPAGYIPLANLHVRDDLDVERYLRALARRDAAVADPGRDLTALDDPTDFAASLDSMCDWAWRAAIGPLVERYLPTLARPDAGRPPRVVLVPMGELARFPWQAARRSDGTYAVQLVAFSQAASARMLCHSAALAPVPSAPVGLVVGDPDTGRVAPDLAAARAEAYAIHRSFYPGGKYVGRRVDGSTSRSGPGGVDEVRDWLTSTSPGSGAMLHLACHGVINTDPESATSYLLLDGGGRLTAEELVELTARSPDRDIGLVVLAACRTGLAINGYDEAYSLGTAFLAGGVRSVLSTQWAIPDRATSVLMYMFHHHVMAEGLPAWEALRRAQIWMLDPERSLPDGMPARLRQQLHHEELAHVAAWAGFVHWGW
ncbi:CHAT domain-containing protein [Micromonospora rubida]|uniref:CHAT domain-containing protein n=1 Tax=Micromonospora rubida TaxID=2697657 RepID=UPI001378303E|nr:CHAT domain-containing protein [Micromonospora rubida]NBE84920.1 CHAT domain-containing protein [Micromonospora rubida]